MLSANLAGRAIHRGSGIPLVVTTFVMVVAGPISVSDSPRHHSNGSSRPRASARAI